MCQHQLLHENHIGHIMRCATCGDFHIHFGNIYSSVGIRGFKKMRKLIRQISDERPPRKDECENSRIMIKTLIANTWLSFSPSEFDEVEELFEIAGIMLDAKGILNG